MKFVKIAYNANKKTLIKEIPYLWKMLLCWDVVAASVYFESVSLVMDKKTAAFDIHGLDYLIL